jgi:hypothetical protein
MPHAFLHRLLCRSSLCAVTSIRRAISERVTSWPEGTIRANRVLAMMRPPAIQAKVNMEPPRVGGNGRQKISIPTLLVEPDIDDGANRSNTH